MQPQKYNAPKRNYVGPTRGNEDILAPWPQSDLGRRPCQALRRFGQAPESTVNAQQAPISRRFRSSIIAFRSRRFEVAKCNLKQSQGREAVLTLRIHPTWRNYGRHRPEVRPRNPNEHLCCTRIRAYAGRTRAKPANYVEACGHRTASAKSRCRYRRTCTGGA